MGGEVLTGNPIRKVAFTFLASLALSFIILQSVFFSILTPLPQMYCYVRLGRPAGIALPAVLFILLTAQSPGLGISYLLQFGITGAVLSEAIVRKFSVNKSGALTVAVAVMVSFLVLSSLAWKEGLSTNVMVKQLTQKVVEESITLYEKVEMPREQIEQFKKSSSKIVDTVPRIFPAILIIAVMITIWVNVLVLTGYFRKKRIDTPFGALAIWKVPDYLVWVLIGAAVFLLNITAR